MTILLHDAVNKNGLFDQLGRLIGGRQKATLASNYPEWVNLMAQVVKDFASGDSGEPLTFRDALQLVQSQMVANGQNLLNSTESVIAAADGGNTGDVLVYVTATDPAGNVAKNLGASVINGTVDSGSVVFSNGPRIPIALAGDKFNRTIGAPSGWDQISGGVLAYVGAPTFEIDRTADGTGTWQVIWNHPTLGTQTTVFLDHDATAEEVASALNGLNGLSVAVTVASGVSPDFVFDVELLSSAGDVGTWSIGESDTSITVLPGPTASTSILTGNSALRLVGAAEVANSLGRTIRMSPGGIYMLDAAVKVSAATTGDLKFELCERRYGPAVQTITIDISTLTTSFQRVMELVDSSVRPTSNIQYLRIVCDNPAEEVIFDSLSIAQFSLISAGGPWAVAVGVQGADASDTWSITIANDEAGLLDSAIVEYLNPRQFGVSLPTSGTPTIPDSVIV